MKKRFGFIFAGVFIGLVSIHWIRYKIGIKKQIAVEKMADKNKELFLMMTQWVKVKQEGKSFTSYFENNGYQKVAVYGMGFAGEALLNEFKGTQIQVAYAIDKNAEGIYTDIDVVKPEDPLDEVDVVVVTAITYFDEIKELLRGKLQCKIISLEDILYEI